MRPTRRRTRATARSFPPAARRRAAWAWSGAKSCGGSRASGSARTECIMSIIYHYMSLNTHITHTHTLHTHIYMRVDSVYVAIC